jgi:putative acetyltransferase
MREWSRAREVKVVVETESMMLVRTEKAADRGAIYRILAGSFPTEGEAKLVDALRAAGRLSVSLVAELNGAVIGHVAFSPVTTDGGAEGVGLGPIAVAEAERRKGVGSRLVEEGIAACRVAGFGWLVVLGDPAYYGRFGFRAASEFGLSDEYRGGPAFQAMELLPGMLPVGAGLVRYAREFAAPE